MRKTRGRKDRRYGRQKGTEETQRSVFLSSHYGNPLECALRLNSCRMRKYLLSLAFLRSLRHALPQSFSYPAIRYGQISLSFVLGKSFCIYALQLMQRAYKLACKSRAKARLTSTEIKVKPKRTILESMSPKKEPIKMHLPTLSRNPGIRHVTFTFEETLRIGSNCTQKTSNRSSKSPTETPL